MADAVEKKVSSLVLALERIIANIETYLASHVIDVAREQEGVAIRTIDGCTQALSNLARVGASTRARNEIDLLSHIKKVLVDMCEHPEHLQTDEMEIALLEKELNKVLEL